MLIYLIESRTFYNNDEGYETSIHALNKAYLSKENAQNFCDDGNLKFVMSDDFIEFYLYGEYHYELESVLEDYKWMEGMPNPITEAHAKDLLRYRCFRKFTFKKVEVVDGND